MAPLPVGFDLDMTLIDSRRAIMASFARVAADTGVRIDPDAVDRRLGIKLEDELSFWFPGERIPLDGVGLTADEIFAEMHGPQKAAVLARLRAAAYVGDTPADMAAAVTAGARAVGVATGSFTDRDLRAAGADDVLASLTEFPALYANLDVSSQSRDQG